jgi:hypothetical protein
MSVERDRGAIAVELPLAVGLLLLPIAVLVMVLPQWPEAKSVATVTAKEAASLYATAGSPEEGAAAAQAAVDRAAANYGRPLTLTIAGDWCRGCTVTAAVTVQVPAFDVPLVGSTGTFDWTATSASRVEDYRSAGG